MLKPGDRLGRYEVVSPLGAGGMGEVYRARDSELQREVALKILPDALASDPDRLRRFEREAKVTAALSHPNVLTVFDVGHEGERTYLVFEMLEGSTLAEVMKSARERGINLRSLHLAPWEHTFYGILEAESAEDIERWLDPILGLGMAKLTPVTDAMSSIGQRLEG